MKLLKKAKFLHKYVEEKDLQSGKTHLPHWSRMCQQTRVERSEEVRIWSRNPDGEALSRIVNKLSDDRNLRDILMM